MPAATRIHSTSQRLRSTGACQSAATLSFGERALDAEAALRQVHAVDVGGHAAGQRREADRLAGRHQPHALQAGDERIGRRGRGAGIGGGMHGKRHDVDFAWNGWLWPDFSDYDHNPGIKRPDACGDKGPDREGTNRGNDDDDDGDDDGPVRVQHPDPQRSAGGERLDHGAVARRRRAPAAADVRPLPDRRLPDPGGRPARRRARPRQRHRADQRRRSAARRRTAGYATKPAPTSSSASAW